MADKRFLPREDDPVACMNHLVEELGEVTAALGKTLRYGPESYNPLLPTSQQERNGDWLLREIDDLEAAIRRTRHSLRYSGFVPKITEERER